MTSHELARALLENPDMPVNGSGVGQGGNEQGDDDLGVVWIENNVVNLSFGETTCGGKPFDQYLAEQNRPGFKLLSPPTPEQA
jgi:hypothetical protein